MLFFLSISYILYFSFHAAKIRFFFNTNAHFNILSFKRHRVDIRIYLVVEGVGGHAEEVGDRVVHVGAEGMDGVADTEVVELGVAEGTFGPGLAVVEVADMVATAPTDVVKPRVLADDPQHLVPPQNMYATT